MSSSAETSAPYNALIAPAPANVLVAAIILGVFVVIAILSATRKEITQGFDEVAHTSYVAQIQNTGNPWPALPTLRMLDPQSFHFTSEPNYLQHTPIFYALLAAIGPTLEGHPRAVLTYRLIDAGLAAVGLAALLGLGLAAGFSRYEFYAYAVPIACIPVLAPVAGSVNNDNLAFFGGAVVTLAVGRFVATDCKPWWLAVALAGVVAAGWAKLTGLVLTGAMVSAVVAYLLWRARLRWTWVIAVALAFALAALPYVIYIAQYGTPVPTTPAAISATEILDFGWTNPVHRSFFVYFVSFVGELVASWMPTLAARNSFHYAMLAIPATTLVGAGVGIVLSLRRLWRRQERTIDVIVISGALGLAVNFVLQVNYSYHFYTTTGWMAGPYLRYYVPLAAIVPLACLSLLSAIETPRWHCWVLGFLIAGPIIFRVFGAPLG
jgi:hypothetical protein